MGPFNFKSGESSLPMPLLMPEWKHRLCGGPDARRHRAANHSEMRQKNLRAKQLLSKCVPLVFTHRSILFRPFLR